MSPVNLGVRGPKRGFPRVSGDEPVKGRGTGGMAVFSPRERG